MKQTKNEIIEKLSEEMQNLPLIISTRFSESVQVLTDAEYDRAMDDVAANLNHLIEQGKENEWHAPYCAALYDLQKRLGFKGTSRELLQ